MSRSPNMDAQIQNRIVLSRPAGIPTHFPALYHDELPEEKMKGELMLRKVWKKVSFSKLRK